MLVLFLPLTLAVQQPAAAPQYATDALRELVRAAAETNIRVPPGLASYRATVETEVALVGVDARGREQSVQVEQVAQQITWDRAGRLDQRVIGYRTQASVFTGLTALSVPTWVVPVLYGNRFSLFFGPRTDSARRRRQATAQDTTGPTRRLDAMHPLAANRDAIYRYSGGDTVAVVRPGGRSIPVVRVHVEPANPPPIRTSVLRGEILLDAATSQLIAMRGELLEIGGTTSLLGRLRNQLFHAVAYIDFESREVEQRYWLPATQRIELQIASPLAGEARYVWRFNSRFDDIEVTRADTILVAEESDTLAALPRRRTIASDTELASYDRWRWPLGEGTLELRADDFDDVVLAASGAAPGDIRIAAGLYARRFDEVLRFNRVEGLFTGIGARVRAFDARRSLSLGGSIGRAWHEDAARGGAFAEWDEHAWRLTGAAERRLEIANPFGALQPQGTSIAALLGTDDFDYLDRRQLILALERDALNGAARLETVAAVAADDDVSTSVSQGLFTVDSGFRENRPVDDGSYARVALSVIMNPDVYAEWARPGWTAGLRLEQGAGELAWMRVEANAGARATVGRFTATGSVEAGLVESGRIPLQQLFAVGGVTDVPGFEYKEFGGDRVIVTRATLRHALPIFQAPMHLPFGGPRRGRLPPLAPALAVGLRSVWADASRIATLDALGRLGTREPSGLLLTRPTGGVRSAASAGMLLFGGGLFVGVARRLDTGARWEFTFAPSLAL